MTQHAAPMAERGERRVLEALATARLESPYGFHRIGFHMLSMLLHGPHAVLGLEVGDGDRVGFQLEQVDDRRAKKTHVIGREAHVIRERPIEYHLHIKVLDAFRDGVQIEPHEIHEHELLGEGEVLQQQLVAAEGVVSLRPQAFLGSESGWLQPYPCHRLGCAGPVGRIARYPHLHGQWLSGER